MPTKIRLTHLMFLIVLVPLIALSYFSISTLQYRNGLITSVTKGADGIRIATLFGALIHEQQKERGTTSGYLSTAGGPSFANQLAKVRLETDARRIALIEALAAIPVANVDPAILAVARDIINNPEKLAEIRARVDRLDITPAEALGYYTQLNRAMIDSITTMGAHNTVPGFGTQVVAYTEFLSAKELSGILRAVGAAAFSQGVFSQQAMDRFNVLSDAHDLKLDAFRLLAEPADEASLNALNNGPEAAALRELRDRARRDGLAGNISDVSGPQWFSTATAYINGLRKIELDLAQGLLARADEVVAENLALSQRDLIVVVIGAGLSLTLCCALLFWTITGFRRLLAPTLALAEGDLDCVLPAAGKNEFGQLAGALHVFRDNEMNNRAHNEKAKNARIAAENERKARAEALFSLQQSIETAVSQAVEGNYTQRLDQDFKDEDLRSLAGSLDSLLDSVGTSMAQLKKMLRSLAQSDLTQRMDGEFSGAFADLQLDANQVADALAVTMATIGKVVSESLEGSHKLRRDAGNLSVRSTDQAASLEEISATIEDLSSSVTSNSVVLSEIGDLARDVLRTSGAGITTAEHTAEAVNRIKESSDKISEIVGVIEAIAFQTNLLALNAAVEAARAGDSGKGFAVVASEVRALAQRSSESAQDIGALIEESATNVADGVTRVEGTAASLGEINNSVSALEAKIADVVKAGQSQATSVAEVRDAISSLDSLTQQNAQMADDSARIASALASSIDALATHVQVFNLPDGARHLDQSEVPDDVEPNVVSSAA